MCHKSLVILLGAVLLFVRSSLPFAQAQDDTTCPIIVEEALRAVGEACGGLDRNSACYGYNNVQATFESEVPEGFFSQPSDRAELTFLKVLQTSPLNPEANEWGVALMNVQANVPNSLPGQAVLFMLVGDTRVENAVAPDAAFQPADPIEISTLTASNLRSEANANAHVVASVPSGATLLADARSTDEIWVRVLFEGQPVWIARSLVSGAGLIDTLPTFAPRQFTPMQAFYFSTGLGQTTCSEAPDSLIIQGPETMEVIFNANGADIVVGSTVALRQPEPGRLQVIAVQGYARVNGITIPGGFTIETSLNQNNLIDRGTWRGFRPLDDRELESLQPLQRVRPGLLHYGITPPSRTEILETQANLARSAEREMVRQRCQDAGLSVEECREFVENMGQDRRLDRCLERFSAVVCNRILVDDEISRQEICRALGYTSPEDCREALNSRDEVEDPTFEERCRALGYSNLADCRAALEARISTPTPDPLQEYIARCQAAGVTQAQCRYIFDPANSSIPWPTRCSNARVTVAQCTILRG